MLDDKPSTRLGLGQDAVRHLKAHGVSAVLEEVDAAGRGVGELLDAYTAKCGADLLVMGAYGSSRVKEFVLGGATEHVLHDPKTPLFLSH